MSFRCLIVDSVHENIAPLLTSIGVRFDYEPEIKRAEIIERLANYDGLIIRSKTRVDQELLGSSKLKFVARPGAGIDNLDEKILKEHNIAIINAPEGNRDAVGEHTIGLMLSLLHNISRGHNEVMVDIWKRDENRGWELGNKVVGIYGLGNSGSAVAAKLSGFGCKVIAYDKYPKPDQTKAPLVELDEFFEKSDIVSLHIPLTTETKNLFDIQYLKKFSQPIVLINASRGKITPLRDIREGIESGQIIQAGLDVLECEKFSQMSSQQRNDFEWLKESGKVLFTPHIAGWTHESYARLNVVLVEKIGAFLEGKDFS